MFREKFYFYADFNCPFCFALNERIMMLGDSGRVLWRGIEHLPAASSRHPTLVDQAELVSEVGVVRKRAPEITLITPTFRPGTKLVNSLVLHLSRKLADNARLIAELRTLIYRSYWHRGQDISDPGVLRRCCNMIGIEYPDGDLPGSGADELADWQREWESPEFHCRLPALKSATLAKPLLGFPTFDLLSNYFSGDNLPVMPDNFAACEMKPRQVILLVGDGIEARCDVTELRPAYQVESAASVEAAATWLRQQPCCPDLVVIDHASLGDAGLAFCSHTRLDPEHRNTTLVVLLARADKAMELAAFDAGATDVMVDLADPKVCQARLDLQLRMKRSSVLLAAMARLDYLTELPNRREFDRRFEEEWLRARRRRSQLGLVVVDIDQFKAYNDHYGHSTGDDCLREVAQAMRRCLQRPADVLARYGGEEFVAILPDTGREGTAEIAQDLCRAVRELNLPHDYSCVAGRVTVSAGAAAAIPTGERAPRSLIEAADDALYEAKQAGRDRARVADVKNPPAGEDSLAATGTFTLVP